MLTDLLVQVKLFICHSSIWHATTMCSANCKMYIKNIHILQNINLYRGRQNNVTSDKDTTFIY